MRELTTWTLVSLKDIAQWGSGGTPSRKNASYYDGDIPWVKTGDLGPRVLNNSNEHITEEAIAKSSAKLFPKGSVAMAMYGATIGKTSILGMEATTNQACAVGNPVEGVTVSEFLYYLLLNARDSFISLGKGGAQPNISQTLIKDYEVYLPPLAEQKVIIEKLDTLLAQVEATKTRLESTLETLKQFRQSVLAAAVSGKLTEDWRHEHSKVDAKAEIQSLLKKREEYFAHLGKEDKPLKRQANNVLLQDLPDSWSYSHIDPFLSLSRAGMKTGPFGSLLKKHEHVNSGIPVLGIENIGHGKYIPGSKIHVTPEKAEDLKGYDVVAGDIVISRSGTVGDVCVLPNDIGEARFSTNIMRLSVMNEYMKPHYLGWLFLGSQIVLDQVAELCKGSTRLFLNQKILSSIKFPIAPLQEQEEIVLRIEKLFSGADATEQQVNQALERVNNLTQSILAKAFRGELTEQWRKENPDLIFGENSAEALLKKIKAERAAAKPKRKTRTTSA